MHLGHAAVGDDHVVRRPPLLARRLHRHSHVRQVTKTGAVGVLRQGLESDEGILREVNGGGWVLAEVSVVFLSSIYC